MSRQLLVALVLVLPIASQEVVGQAPETTAARRYALLVGCTAYPSLPLALRLEGPGNDVQLLHKLLVKHYGLAEDDITVLADGEDDQRRPTRANIEAAFRRLAQVARRGDQVLIFLAGHGSQQPNENPDDADDPEPDGLDETFLPADIGDWVSEKQRVENAIVDDEIRDWLRNIRQSGAFVWIVLDACHSGSMSRGGPAEVSRFVPVERLVPAAALAAARQRVSGTGVTVRGHAPTHSVMKLADPTGGLVALYACQANQRTYERPLPPESEEAQRYGLLSYAMSVVLSRATTPLTYRELAQRIHQQYLQWGPDNPTPLLEGTELDREILGQKTWEARSRILLSQGPAGSLTINSGALQGVSRGSVLRVWPADLKPGDKILGHVQVTAVEPLVATVVPCAHEESDAPIDLPVGGRCEVVFLNYGDARLRLAVDPLDIHDQTVPAELFEQLTTMLKPLDQKPGSPVKLVKSPAAADWLLRSGGKDGAAYLVPVEGWLDEPASPGETPTPAARRRFGPVARDERLSAWLEETLAKVARVRRLLSLGDEATAPVWEADKQAAALREIDVQLVRYLHETSNQQTSVAWEGGRWLYRNDLVRFLVKNRGPQTVDVTMLHIDGDYGVTAFFPPAGFPADSRVPPGGSTGTPLARVTSAAGEEHMVVIAVRAEAQQEPVDLSWLAQTSLAQARGVRLRGAPGRYPLERLFEDALFGETRTRGLDSSSIGNYTVKRISWKVHDRLRAEE